MTIRIGAGTPQVKTSSVWIEHEGTRYVIEPVEGRKDLRIRASSAGAVPDAIHIQPLGSGEILLGGYR